MSRRRALLLYNSPLLEKDRSERDLSAEARAERGVAEAVEAVAAVLESEGWAVARWALSPLNVSSLIAEVEGVRPEVVVNLFEGFPGVEDQEALVAELLEGLGVPYTGNGPRALELCRRKELCGRVLRAGGIATPGERVIRGGPEGIAGEAFGWPALLKPAWEDGSVGVTRESVVSSPEELRCYLSRAEAWLDGRPLLLQEYVPGREFAVSLLGADPMRAVAVSEMDFSCLPEGHPPIVTAEAKWCEDSEAYRGVVPRCPAPLEPALAEALCRTALEAAVLLGLRDYARLDFRLREGRPVVIDANPNPDLAPRAGFARSAEAAGLGYRELVLGLVELALAREGARRD